MIVALNPSQGIINRTSPSFCHYFPDQDTRMSPTERNVVVGQCGGGPVVENKDKDKETDVGEDKPKEQEKKEHCWTCTDEFHCRGEVERSMENFDWKVVEPYDGNTLLYVWM